MFLCLSCCWNTLVTIDLLYGMKPVVCLRSLTTSRKHFTFGSYALKRGTFTKLIESWTLPSVLNWITATESFKLHINSWSSVIYLFCLWISLLCLLASVRTSMMSLKQVTCLYTGICDPWLSMSTRLKPKVSSKVVTDISSCWLHIQLNTEWQNEPISGD